MGGKSSAPPAPDYAGAAQEQSRASKEIANQQTWANRPDQTTPWGSSSWSTAPGVDPGTGQPITQWSQTQTLEPRLQGALDSQIDLQKERSDLGQSFMGRVEQDYEKPFDWQNLQDMSGKLRPTTQATNANEFAKQREDYTNAAFDQMRPEHQFQEESARTRLANQGLTPGSEAYNRELGRVADAQAGERWNAVNQGGLEQQRMQNQLRAQEAQSFGQEQTASSFQNQLRQQGIAEQAQKRGMSLNEMNAMLTGQQVSSPTMPTFMGASAGQAPNLLGAAQAKGQYGINSTQIDQANDQANMQGLGSLASMAAMYFGGR
jgi:hypothetical protein